MYSYLFVTIQYVALILMKPFVRIFATSDISVTGNVANGD